MMDRTKKNMIAEMARQNEQVAVCLFVNLIDVMDPEGLEEVFDAFAFNSALADSLAYPENYPTATAGCECIKCRVKRVLSPGAPEKKLDEAGNLIEPRPN